MGLVDYTNYEDMKYAVRMLLLAYLSLRNLYSGIFQDIGHAFRFILINVAHLTCQLYTQFLLFQF